MTNMGIGIIPQLRKKNGLMPGRGPGMGVGQIPGGLTKTAPAIDPFPSGNSSWPGLPGFPTPDEWKYPPLDETGSGVSTGQPCRFTTFLIVITSLLLTIMVVI